jgi:hypothetical protein
LKTRLSFFEILKFLHRMPHCSLFQDSTKFFLDLRSKGCRCEAGDLLCHCKTYQVLPAYTLHPGLSSLPDKISIIGATVNEAVRILIKLIV